MASSQFYFDNRNGNHFAPFSNNNLEKQSETELINQFQKLVLENTSVIDFNKHSYNPQDLPQFNFMKNSINDETQDQHSITTIPGNYNFPPTVQTTQNSNPFSIDNNNQHSTTEKIQFPQNSNSILSGKSPQNYVPNSSYVDAISPTLSYNFTPSSEYSSPLSGNFFQSSSTSTSITPTFVFDNEIKNIEPPSPITDIRSNYGLQTYNSTQKVIPEQFNFSSFNNSNNSNSSLFEPPKQSLLPPTPLFPLKGFPKSMSEIKIETDNSLNHQLYNTEHHNIDQHQQIIDSKYSPLDPEFEYEDDIIETEYCEQKYSCVNNNFSKQTGRNLDKDLVPFGFSDDINKKTNEIFHLIGCPVNRKTKRKLLIYGCVYFAHKENDIDFIPEKLATKIGIDFKMESKAISMIRKRGYTKKFEDKNPLYYLNYFLNNSALCTLKRDELYRILQLIEPIAKSNFLPQEIAMGVIDYFLTIKSLSLNMHDPINNTSVNFKKISEIKEQIAIIDI